ncbi:hypothetical protein L1987_19280 [Smallanthus sonchifolius]|uniref:Uncharacterized protein n=1 Tax=Smallanthus sonchifolius TaxID=185202 RepID=A0ACB9IRI9_9ASTR|nr:hypothetical protein L1987_19280 [Smallanthus sonchifolius]
MNLSLHNSDVISLSCYTECRFCFYLEFSKRSHTDDITLSIYTLFYLFRKENTENINFIFIQSERIIPF